MAKSGSHLCYHIMYAFFLFLSALFTLLAAIFPAWIIGEGTADSSNPGERRTCGFFVECQSAKSTSCPNYEFKPPNISSLPLTSWQVSFGTLAVAVVICWLSFLVSLVTCCFCYGCTKAQIPALTASTIFLLISLLAFGYGLGDLNVEVAGIGCYCPGSSRFQMGSCDLGYGGAVTIVATILISITICIASKVKALDREHGMIA